MNLKQVRMNFRTWKATSRSAVMDFQKALQLKPTLVHAYAYLIRIASTMGNSEIQKQFFNAALAQNPYSIVARQVHLAKLAPRWGGSMAEMQDVVDESRKYIENYPEIRIVESEIDIELGVQALEEKDYPGVIKHITSAIARGDSAIAYFRRGQGYMYSNQNAEAISDFDKAITMNPSYIYAYEACLSCNMRLKDFPRARADLDQLIELSPKAEYYANRGTLRGWFLPGQTKYAASDLEEAVRLDPTNNSFKEALTMYQKKTKENTSDNQKK